MPPPTSYQIEDLAFKVVSKVSQENVINIDKFFKKTKTLERGAIFIAILGFINFWQPSNSWFRQGVIYVAPNGSDWNLGQNPKYALKTIQRAADLASPGETIVILPGTYYETLRIHKSGYPNQPITFKAQNPGTVKITNAAPPQTLESLTWQSEGDEIFSTTPPWLISRLIFRDGTNLYKSPQNFTLDKFRALVRRNQAYSAFFYDSELNKLYVFLDKKYSIEELQIPKQLPIQDKFNHALPSANLWLEADYIILKDLTFELGLRTGILLWDAQHITIQGCSFYGADYGIADYIQISPAQAITIEQNFYHNYPQYYWFRDWLSWAETYSSGSRSTLVGLHGSEIVIAQNLVSHAGDGLQISPQFSNEKNQNKTKSIKTGANIYENLLFQGTDDAIELDGFAQNVHIHNNLIYNFFTSLGLSPVLKGPVTIEDNFFLHPYEAQRVNDPAHFKLLNPWFRKEGNIDRNIIQNITVSNNVLVGNWLAWWHEAPVQNMRVNTNVLATQRKMEPPLPASIETIQNINIQLPLEGYLNPGTDPQWRDYMNQLQTSIWQIPKPGPQWLNYNEHTATREISTTLSNSFFLQPLTNTKP